MIPRHASAALAEAARAYPIVAITGPRQSGKTTLARETFPDHSYVSLEDLDERAHAERDPRGFLARYPDGAIIDEAQRCPALFSYLQTTVDAQRRTGLFILTGSQQFGLMSGIAQSLAGRVGAIELLPFGMYELAAATKLPARLESVLWKGLYPALYDRDVSPSRWYSDYVRTYVERDVRQIANIQDLGMFQRFLKTCAARTGQILNLSSLANDIGISHVTARGWLSVLEASYIVFTLRPYFRNFGKRLVKSPKLYFHDPGLAGFLLGLEQEEWLANHPARGALFETLVVNEFMKVRLHQGMPGNIFYWRDNIGTEVDMVIESGEKLTPVEIKAGQTFATDYISALTRWSKYAGSLAGQPHVIYAGNRSYEREGVAVHSWRDV
jgi:uncharacterized protein